MGKNDIDIIKSLLRLNDKHKKLHGEMMQTIRKNDEFISFLEKRIQDLLNKISDMELKICDYEVTNEINKMPMHKLCIDEGECGDLLDTLIDNNIRF